MARVLIVEDYRAAANMIETIVAVEGHATTIARTGEDALARILEDAYDLVLLDIGLPGLDGWSILRIFLHLPDPPAVIVISGQLDQGDDIKAISLGAQAALLKPFEHDELCRTIEAVLEERAKSR